MRAFRMAGEDRRRSARLLLGAPAKIYSGPETFRGVVRDVSRHGMGIDVPPEAQIGLGEIIWVVAEAVAPYAITGIVVRTELDGIVGVDFEEVLEVDDSGSLVPVVLTEDFGVQSPSDLSSAAVSQSASPMDPERDPGRE